MAIQNSLQASKEKPFRVIIVGGGVAGLTLAHNLELANVDYVLLDKGVVAPPWGTSISIHPNGCRILHQIGALDAVQAKCVPMEKFYNRGPSGHSYVHDFFFQSVKQRTGYTTLTLERRAFLQALYDTLSDKSKIRERCRVMNVIEENSMVRVLLDDGTEEVGDLVVGADGVHSAVREIMWKTANETIPGYISAAEKRCMKVTYSAIIACVPQQPGLGPNHMHSTSFNDLSFLMLCQPDTIYLAAHFKLPKSEQTRWPSKTRYTEADMEAYAAKVADHPVSESVLFGELWRKKTRAHIVSLQEGVLDHWFFGRTALLGDSVHKVTPNAGFGGSTAMESSVVLANAIQGAIAAHPNKKPSDVEIKDALENYQKIRKSRVLEIFWVSWALTRLQSYSSWFFYTVQRWILPVLGLNFVGLQVAKTCCQVPLLKYVAFTQQQGSLNWESKVEPLDNTKGKMTVKPAADKSAGIGFKTLLPLVLGVTILASTGFMMLGGARHGLPGFIVVE